MSPAIEPARMWRACRREPTSHGHARRWGAGRLLRHAHTATAGPLPTGPGAELRLAAGRTVERSRLVEEGDGLRLLLPTPGSVRAAQPVRPDRAQRCRLDRKPSARAVRVLPSERATRSAPAGERACIRGDTERAAAAERTGSCGANASARDEEAASICRLRAVGAPQKWDAASCGM